MSHEVEIVLDAQATIGESPTWAADERALYWIDIKEPALHRYDVMSHTDDVRALGSDIGAFALLEGHKGSLLALRTGLFRLDFASRQCVCVVRAPFDPELFRFNEGACDAMGRFWVGAMFDPVRADASPRQAPLHSFTFEDGLRQEPDSAQLHNGMAWSPDGRIFYIAHSEQREILAYSFDAAEQALHSPRVLATVPEHSGIPDGAAVDTEGGYWCAIHGGGRLHRYTAAGDLDVQISLPVSQPTMCAFGGEGMDTLYITSAREKLTAEQLRQEPHAGSILSLRVGKRGVLRHCVVR